MKECSVSVCVPVYNVEQYIARCLESILSQSLKNIEIIVVNDCTPDKSMDIVRMYAKNDSRIKIIEHDTNHGLMMARRTGYMAAKGDYVTFVDSDDSLAEEALMALYTAAIDEGADIVSGTIQYVPSNDKRFLWPNRMRYGTDKISVYKSILKGECGHNLCSRLFKRELLKKYTYQTFEGATNGEDGILFYQLIDNAQKVVAINFVVYEYFQNSDSSSQVRYSARALHSILVLNLMRLRTAGRYPELKNLVNKYISNVLFNLKAKGYDINNLIEEQELVKLNTIRSLMKYNGFWAYPKYLLRLIVEKIR